MKIHIYILILAALLSAGCTGRGGDGGEYAERVYSPAYAGGFEILGREGSRSTVIETKTPWQGADSTAVTRLYVSRDGERPPQGFEGQVVEAPARRIVCMSSTQIAMLAATGLTDRVVGVSGLRFISNPDIRRRSGEIGDVGFDANIDYELLMALSPDLVLLYGIAGASMMESKLNELGIPYMYVSEYLEENPLGKAEWMVAVNEVTDTRGEAEEVFARIPRRYNELRELAATAAERPTVMLNTPYGDSWVIPSSQSYAMTLIKDAGARAACEGDQSTRSMPIGMEKAYLATCEADFWLNVGQARTMAELLAMLPKFADTKPVVNHRVWNSTKTYESGGANDYWESGVVRPHLVLQDLIKIFHPELLPEASFTYYQKLE